MGVSRAQKVFVVTDVGVSTRLGPALWLRERDTQRARALSFGLLVPYRASFVGRRILEMYILVLVDPRPLQPLQPDRLLAVHAALREADDQPSAYVRVDGAANFLPS